MTPVQKEHIQILLARYLAGSSTATEEANLFALIHAEADNQELQELLEEFIAAEQEIIINREEYHPILESILQKRGRVLPLYKRPAFRWIAAAAIIIIIAGLAVVGLLTNNHPASPVGVHANDIAAPTNTRAVITLANGTKVYLDSAGNGTIAQENNVNVVKGDSGQISYSLSANGDQRSANSLSYNTLSNPRGSKVISLTLSDGTKVWLNSESSLKYPTAFTSTTREVEITGEAYFEVQHNAKQPFKVHLPNGGVVEDIGTAFNVNAYGDESDIKTTLIEGSVKLSSSRPGVLAVKLKPGQQAILNPNSHSLLTTSSIDLAEVVAWKNGSFSYTNSDLETIMRQMARWYDVEVVYKDHITDRYTVDVPRTVPVSQLFKFIEMSGGVHFDIEGKKITVHK